MTLLKVENWKESKKKKRRNNFCYANDDAYYITNGINDAINRVEVYQDLKGFPL